MIYEEYDPDLDEAIKLATPEFGSSLKRRFTNVGVSQSIKNSNKGPTVTKLDDVYVRDGQNRIQLKNIQMQDPLAPRMNEIIPNLKERHLRISADWYSITLKGTYQMFNTSQIKLLPVISTGDFFISIENTLAQGLVGFTTAGEALQATNFDINYDATNVSVQVEYFNTLKGAKERNSVKNEEIGNTIAKHIRSNLYSKLEESLRKNLNQVLLDYNLMEIFSENIEICDKYKKIVRTTDRTTNIFVDRVIAEVNRRNRISFNLPNINESGFVAHDGKLANLQTLKRRQFFSRLTNSEDGLVTIFGEIELSNCTVTYGYWNFWILHGFLKVNVPKNRIKLKFSINPVNFGRGMIALSEAKIRVLSLENLEIDVSGLGIFNWVSEEITAVINNEFETDIVRLLSDKLNKSLQQFAGKGLQKRPKQ